MNEYLLEIWMADYWLHCKSSEMLKHCNAEPVDKDWKGPAAIAMGSPLSFTEDVKPTRIRMTPYEHKTFRFLDETDEDAVVAAETFAEEIEPRNSIIREVRRYIIRRATLTGPDGITLWDRDPYK